MTSEEPFKDQTAIVTGGGRNIGRATAIRLAELGMRVVVAGRRLEPLQQTVTGINERERAAFAIQTDCTDADQCERLVEETESRFGAVDLCCAFAGGGMETIPLDAMSPERVSAILEDNLLTAALTARAMLPGFRARDRGTLILAAGGGAFVPVLDFHLHVYAAAKAGVCRLVDQLTAEHWHSSLRFFAIDPGKVPDEPRRAAFLEHERRTGSPHPDSVGTVDPAEVAELVALLHDDRSRPLRGRCVSVHDRWWRDPEARREVDRTIHAYRLRRADL